MSKGVNKVILIGRLGNDPDVRYTPAGIAVATISVATNFSTKDKQTGEWRDETEWHRVVLFERTAEVAKQYLRKGSQIYIEGRLRTNKWQDKNGMDRYTTEVIARDMQMLDSRSDGGAGGYGAPGADGYSPYAQPAQQQPAGGYPAPPQQPAGGYPAPPQQPAGGYPAPPPVNQPAGGYSAPPPANQGMEPPPTGGSEGMSQSTQSTPPPATGATNPPPDKGFNEDVPF